MCNIWRFIIPSRILIHWSYYICSYCRVGKQNKEVSLIKLHGHDYLIFSHIWHWSYLLMFLKQGIIFESWKEDVPNKSQRHSKRPWYLWIWDYRIFCQEWKWTYDCAPVSGILCYWVTKGSAHRLTTMHLYIIMIQGYLHSSFSWW